MWKINNARPIGGVSVLQVGVANLPNIRTVKYVSTYMSLVRMVSLF